MFYTIVMADYSIIIPGFDFVFPRLTKVFCNGVQQRQSEITAIGIVDYSEKMFDVSSMSEYSFKDSLRDFFYELIKRK